MLFKGEHASVCKPTHFVHFEPAGTRNMPGLKAESALRFRADGQQHLGLGSGQHDRFLMIRLHAWHFGPIKP